MTDAAPLPVDIRSETGSFRDWDGRVFSIDGRIVRALTEDGHRDWLALSESALFHRHTASGELVGSTPADNALLARVQSADRLGSWVHALSHERLPFISYPYEWSFSMLRDAALLQLRLTSEALQEGLILKDASPYNVQWRGAQPVFIDVGSFGCVRPGEPWHGYRQFCALYLYPLMLEAYRRIRFSRGCEGASKACNRPSSAGCSGGATCFVAGCSTRLPSCESRRSSW